MVVGLTLGLRFRAYLICYFPFSGLRLFAGLGSYCLCWLLLVSQRFGCWGSLISGLLDLLLYRLFSLVVTLLAFMSLLLYVVTFGCVLMMGVW